MMNNDIKNIVKEFAAFLDEHRESDGFIDVTKLTYHDAIKLAEIIEKYYELSDTMHKDLRNDIWLFDHIEFAKDFLNCDIKTYFKTLLKYPVLFELSLGSIIAHFLHIQSLYNEGNTDHHALN